MIVILWSWDEAIIDFGIIPFCTCRLCLSTATTRKIHWFSKKQIERELFRFAAFGNSDYSGRYYQNIISDTSIDFLKIAPEQTREPGFPELNARAYMDLRRTNCIFGEYLKPQDYPDLDENLICEHPAAIIHTSINPIKSPFLPGNRTKQEQRFVKH